MFKKKKNIEIEMPEINNSNRIYQFILILALVGLVGIIIYAIGKSEVVLWISSSLIIGLAIFMVGGLIGFLFGVPKVNLHYSKNDNKEYLANTSLEEISDWLTKIIIGLGLTQLIKIPSYMKILSENIVLGITNNNKHASGDTSYILFLVIYYSLLGFFFAYFFARLELKNRFVDSETYKMEKDKTDSLKKRLDSKIENEKEQLTNAPGELKKILTPFQKNILTLLLDSEKKTYRAPDRILTFSEFIQLSELINLGVIKLCDKGKDIYELTEEYEDLKKSDFI
jgi:hypothetical protein